MINENNLFPHAAVASSAYASMAAFTAAANMYNSFYPTANANCDQSVNYFGSNEVKRERLDSKISVKLESSDLWQQFSSIGTEMIITKNGRRLFPNYRVSITELDPNAKYSLLLDIVPMDDNRYKFQESAWIISGKAEPHVYGRYYIHPDSPQTGAQWMKQSILFNKVKITNNPMQNPEQILLNSMHRYIPRLHIIEASDDCSIRSGPFSTFVFDETAFIAVTAYQNDRIKNLKIDNNPFAKGFREPTHGKKNSSKGLKRLQSSLPLDKKPQSNEDPQRLCKSESSLHSPSSSSPPLHSTMIDPTTPTYRNTNIPYPEPTHDMPVFNFPPIYSAYQQFPSYDQTAAYGYYYPPNGYNPSFF